MSTSTTHPPMPVGSTRSSCSSRSWNDGYSAWRVRVGRRPGPPSHRIHQRLQQTGRPVPLDLRRLTANGRVNHNEFTARALGERRGDGTPGDGQIEVRLRRGRAVRCRPPLLPPSGRISPSQKRSTPCRREHGRRPSLDGTGPGSEVIDECRSPASPSNIGDARGDPRVM